MYTGFFLISGWVEQSAAAAGICDGEIERKENEIDPPPSGSLPLIPPLFSP